jgi:hypothetical protein
MGKPTIFMAMASIAMLDYQRDPEGKGLFGFLDEPWD